MKVSQLVKLLRNGNAAEVCQVIENRKLVNQTKLRFLMNVTDHGCIIEEDNMGQATWYYISDKNNNLLSSQFYWNDGEYDAEGNHSLYDEYGMAL